MLKDITYILFRQKYKILVFFITSLIVTLLALSVRDRVYEASAIIFVKLGREISIPTQDLTFTSGAGRTFAKRSEDIWTEKEILDGRYLIEEVVREIGHEKILGKEAESDSDIRNSGITIFEQAVLALEGNLKTELLGRSDAIKISYYHKDATVAEAVLEILLDKYMDRHINVHMGTDMTEFFQPQKKYFKEKLEQIESNLLKTKNDANYYLLAKQRSELLEHLTDMREELEETKRDIHEKSIKVARIKEQLLLQSKIIDLPDLEDVNPMINTLNNALVPLEVRREQLLGKYAQNSRNVSNIDSEIEKVNELLKAEYTRILQTNEKDLEISKLRASMLEAEITGYLSELESLNSAESKVDILQREKDIANQNYRLYVQKYEQSRITGALDRGKVTNVRLIQPAAVSFKPVGPSNKLIIAISIVFSLTLGTVIAFIFERFDHTLTRSSEIEKYLNIRVLGTISEGAAK